MAEANDALGRLLESVVRALGPEAARALVALRVDAALQGRVDELADRCNEGQLSNDEREEYRSLVAAAGVIALLQARARGMLTASGAK